MIFHKIKLISIFTITVLVLLLLLLQLSFPVAIIIAFNTQSCSSLSYKIPSSSKLIVTFTPPVADTYICSGEPTRNLGATADLYVGYYVSSTLNFERERALLRFDVSTLPSNAVITSANLVLTIPNDGWWTGSGSLPITVYALTQAWVEGTGIYSEEPTTDGANWNTYDGINGWLESGGDYFETPSATTEVPTAVGSYYWEVTEIVQAWVDGTFPNHGFILISEAEAVAENNDRGFASAQYSDNLEARPKLVVEYIENQPPTATIISIEPNPAREGYDVTFVGEGADPDGSIIEYEWVSDIVGIIGTSASFTKNDLPIGIHQITFRVKDDVGVWSEPVTTTLQIIEDLPPEPIANLYAFDTPNDNGGSITISWSPNLEDDFDHYRIYIRYLAPITTVIGLTPELIIPDYSVTTVEITSCGGAPLEDNVDYYLAVTAVDMAGNELETPSTVGPVQAIDNLPPEPLTNVQAIDTPNDQGGSITISWERSVDPHFSYYAIYIELNYFQTVNGLTPETKIYDQNTTSYELTTYAGGTSTLDPTTNYYVAVTVVDYSGNENTNVSAIGPIKPEDNLPPEPIANVHAFDTPEDNGGSITVSWSVSTAVDFHHYNVYIHTEPFNHVAGLDQQKVIIQKQSITSIELTDVNEFKIQPNVNYWVAVTATDIHDNENPNVNSYGPVQAIDNLPPSPITGLTAIDTPDDNGGSITLSWQSFAEPIPDFDHYEIYVITQKPPSSQDLQSIQPEDSSIRNLMQTSATITTCNGIPLTDNQNYYFVVIPVDTSGNADKNNYQVAGPIKPLDNIPPTIISYNPTNTELTLSLELTTTYEFSIRYDSKNDPEVDIDWKLDGNLIDTAHGKSNCTLTLSTLSLGTTHKLTVIVYDTAHVIEHSWNITVVAEADAVETDRNESQQQQGFDGWLQNRYLPLILIFVGILLIACGLVAVIILRRKRMIAEEEAVEPTFITSAGAQPQPPPPSLPSLPQLPPTPQPPMIPILPPPPSSQPSSQQRYPQRPPILSPLSYQPQPPPTATTTIPIPTPTTPATTTTTTTTTLLLQQPQSA